MAADDEVQARLERLLESQSKLLIERMDGIWRLDEERWRSHTQQHEELAQALRDYKVEANEWRATLSDLRNAFLPRTEFAAEHKALGTEIRAVTNALDGRIDSVELTQRTAGTTELASRNATREVLNGMRNIILLGLAILGGIISLLVLLRP